MNKSTIVRSMRPLARMVSELTPQFASQQLERLFLTPRRLPARDGEVAVMRRARRASVWIEEAGRNVPIYVWGGVGPTVLLVHGWSGRACQLSGFVEPLLNRGFRVVAFDAPAHGRATGRQAGLPDFATAALHVAQISGPIHGVVAHSMGTSATTLALTWGMEARRLVYLAPPLNPGSYLHRAARTLGFSDAVGQQAQRRIEKRFGVPFEELEGQRRGPLMTVPLTVFHDLGDRQVPWEEGHGLATAWPDAQLVTTEGLGHNRILRDRTVVANVVDILLGQSVSDL